MRLFTLTITSCIYLLLLFTSCLNSKKIPYFQDIQDPSKQYTQTIKESYEAHIEPDDIIEIIVNSINPQATAIFNLGNNTPAISGQTTASTMSTAVFTNDLRNQNSTGYLVNKQGIIDFPVLGKLSVKNLTMSQLKDMLVLKLDQYLKNPIVNVRLLNYKITVLGEVNKPSSFTLQSERVSVMDAIGLAGDLTIYGKRENVLLVREENGQRNFIRLNLNSSKLFQSPYYYLKQNDVIYIEPNKGKIAASDARTIRNLSILSTIATVLVVIVSRIK